MIQDCSSEERRRRAALYETGLLFSDPASNFDRVTSLASRMFKTKISLISFASDDLVWHKSMQGCDLPTLPRSSSFCDQTIRTDEPLIVHEAIHDPHFSHHPRVAAGPGVRFYAGVPISLAPGVRIGALGILDPKPRHFTRQDAEALEFLAKMVVTEIRLLATARALRDVLSA
jgi:GAF domain-containing protein